MAESLQSNDGDVFVSEEWNRRHVTVRKKNPNVAVSDLLDEAETKPPDNIDGNDSFSFSEEPDILSSTKTDTAPTEGVVSVFGSKHNFFGLIGYDETDSDDSDEGSGGPVAKRPRRRVALPTRLASSYEMGSLNLTD